MWQKLLSAASALTGSHADRNVIVPTDELANNGVYKKCGRGDTTTTSVFGEAHFRRQFNAPHPEPRITTFSGSPDALVFDEWK